MLIVAEVTYSDGFLFLPWPLFGHTSSSSNIPEFIIEYVSDSRGASEAVKGSVNEHGNALQPMCRESADASEVVLG